MTARLRAALICDDVRTEVSGKSIFIGVYGPEINVSQFPVVLHMYFVPIVDAEAGAERAVKMRIVRNTSDVIGEMRIGFELEKTASGVILPAFAIPLPFSEPGTFRLEHEENEAWHTVETWTVGGTPTPIGADQAKNSEVGKSA